jgi:uncharacterized membrane protein
LADLFLEAVPGVNRAAPGWQVPFSEAIRSQTGILTAAVGMIMLLVGALAVHRQAGDNPKDAIPAFVALGLSAVYLVLLLSH